MKHYPDHKPTMIDKRTGKTVRHLGGRHRCAFWQGYDGNVPVWINPRGHAIMEQCWRDGRDWRKIDEKNDEVLEA